MTRLWNLASAVMVVVVVVVSTVRAGTDVEFVKDEGPNLGNTLHTLLRDKMEDVREIITHGHSGSGIPKLDPFRVDDLSLMIQEPMGFVNVSLHKTTITGLGDFTVKDIASNFDIMRTSVMTTCPELKVSSNYKIKGFLNPPLFQSINDAGRFEAQIKDFESSWSAKVRLGKRSDDIVITQTSFSSYYDDTVKRFQSFLKKGPIAEAKELVKAMGDAIVEKLQSVIEDHLYQAMQQIVGKGTASASLQDIAEELQAAKPGRRTKRQVPCSNGEELDEYVDTLLRFGRRIIRLMEPFRFPNTTIKVDDLLLVFLYNGGVRGISTVERRKPAFVMCRNESITLGVVLGLDSIRVNAKYRVLKDYHTLLFNGDADIRVEGTEVFGQLTQMMNGQTSQNLDRLKIRRLGHVRVLLRGLGNLTSAISMLLTQQINQDPAPVIRVAEAQILSIARQQLANVTIPVFSVI